MVTKLAKCSEDAWDQGESSTEHWPDLETEATIAIHAETNMNVCRITTKKWAIIRHY